MNNKRFCDHLRELRKLRFGFNKFWKELGITNVYLSGLENGSKLPPPPERQLQIINLLNNKIPIDDNDKKLFFDLAAKERKELPADIFDYYVNHKEISAKFRAVIEGENK